MQHLVLFRAAAQAAGAANVGLTIVNDQVVPTSQAGRALLPWNVKIRGAIARGVGMNRPRISSPILRLPNFPQIRPLEITLTPSDPPNVAVYPYDACPFVGMNQELTVETSNTDAGAQEHIAALFLEPRYEPAPPGPVFTVRATAAITGSANQWDSGALTLEDQLPEGLYGVVGLNVWGANSLFARLIFSDQIQRPGVLTTQTVAPEASEFWRYGKMGLLGKFRNTTIPTLDLYKTAAGTTQEVFMDCVKLGE